MATKDARPTFHAPTGPAPVERRFGNYVQAFPPSCTGKATFEMKMKIEDEDKDGDRETSYWPGEPENH